MSIRPLPSWPPYLVSFLTFLGTFLASGIIVGAYLILAAWKPGLALDEVIGTIAAEAAGSPTVLLLSAAVTSSILAGVALFVASRRGSARARMRLFSAAPVDAFAATVGVLGLGMMLDTVVVLIGQDGEGALGTIRDSLAALSTEKLVVAGLVIGVLPGIGEELFFRGYLMRRMQASQGTLVALVVSSIVFGIFHFDAIHTPTAALIGLYLGLMVLLSGSLWTGIVAHAINNFTAAMTVRQDLDPALAGIWFCIGLNAAFVSLYYVWRRHRRFAPVAFW